MAVRDYSDDPNLNTTISGINIAEGCPPSGINNAIRQLMADVKKNADEQDSAVAEEISSELSALEDKLSKVMTGATSSAAGAAGLVPAPAKGAQNCPLRGDGTWANTLDARLLSSLVDFVALVGRDDGTSRLSLRSQKDTNGAALNLYGISCSSLGGGTLKGAFQLLAAKSSSSFKALVGDPDGDLRWDGDHVLNGGDVMLYGIQPNGAVQYLPDGGSWGLLRMQATAAGAVASFYAGRLAGGSAVNVKNGNTQVILAIRTSY